MQKDNKKGERYVEKSEIKFAEFSESLLGSSSIDGDHIALSLEKYCAIDSKTDDRIMGILSSCLFTLVRNKGDKWRLTVELDGGAVWLSGKLLEESKCLIGKALANDVARHNWELQRLKEAMERCGIIVEHNHD